MYDDSTALIPQGWTEEFTLFKGSLELYKDDFLKLAYVIFPWGERGSDLEKFDIYPWQKEQLQKLTNHLKNPKTRDLPYKLACSSGNGAAKTSFGAMVAVILMYTYRTKGRVTSNTKDQLKDVVWLEYEKWFKLARFSDKLFDIQKSSIEARDAKVREGWQINQAIWSDKNYHSLSGLHNKGGAVFICFEESAKIPKPVWEYVSAAFTESDTVKVMFAFANSSDPESMFEQCMKSPYWKSLRLDIRDLPHVPKSLTDEWLHEAGGNEDDDTFRRRVRGLPAKSGEGAIIPWYLVEQAIERRKTFSENMVEGMPSVLGVDLAWSGGDECCITYRKGHYIKLIDRFKLIQGQTHRDSYLRICEWEKLLKTTAVWIDKGEGTAVYSYAVDEGKNNWQMFDFASAPYDKVIHGKSEYRNLRIQMYYKLKEALMNGAILDVQTDDWLEEYGQQICWTKEKRDPQSGQKLAEPKTDIRKRVGKSPDMVDSTVLTFARPLTFLGSGPAGGVGSVKMEDHPNPIEENEDRIPTRCADLIPSDSIDSWST